MHREVGRLLTDCGIVKSSPEEAFDSGVTEAFFPHGLGHLLGTQTHDIGGHLTDERGTIKRPDPRYPALRLTREIEPDMVFTIEPGIYFIPMLLAPIRERTDIDWRLVDELTPCGGIRIEDNVVVTATGCRNLTRPVFEAMESKSPAVRTL